MLFMALHVHRSNGSVKILAEIPALHRRDATGGVIVAENPPI
jgi:hypothetical protein